MAVCPEQNPNFFPRKSGRRFLIIFARAGREEKGVWGKCPEGVASRPYGVKIPAPPSLARPEPKGEGGLFRRRRISCQLKTGAPPLLKLFQILPRILFNFSVSTYGKNVNKSFLATYQGTRRIAILALNSGKPNA